MLLPSLCQDDSDATSAVYIVALRQAPTSHYYGELRKAGDHIQHGASRRSRFHKPRTSVALLQGIEYHCLMSKLYNSATREAFVHIHTRLTVLQVSISSRKLLFSLKALLFVRHYTGTLEDLLQMVLLPLTRFEELRDYLTQLDDSFRVVYQHSE